MRIAPRHLVLLNGLTVVACLLHLLVHALDVHVGGWHDYAVYTLVATSFVVSLVYGRQQQADPLAA